MEGDKNFKLTCSMLINNIVCEKKLIDLVKNTLSKHGVEAEESEIEDLRKVFSELLIKCLQLGHASCYDSSLRKVLDEYFSEKERSNDGNT